MCYQVSLINGRYSPVVFADNTPNQVVYTVCDELDIVIDWRELQAICNAYPHLTPLVSDAKQFASNLCRLAVVEGVKASTYYKLSRVGGRKGIEVAAEQETDTTDYEYEDYRRLSGTDGIAAMDWKEFMELEEVQVDQSLSGSGNALFYNDGVIQVSVYFDGHDDTSLWEDEKLAKELQKLVVEELERKN